MKITKVCCQGCGADLDIDENIRFVTCNYCHARLEIVHDATVTHTKRLDQIERKTDDIAKKLRVIELQNSLTHLDKEWEKFRGSVLISDGKGNLREPSEGVAALKGILGFGCGIAWIIFNFNQNMGLAFLGLGIFAITIFWMRNESVAAGSFTAQKMRYEAARKSIANRLREEQEENWPGKS